jgi:hypothetical protein
METTVTISLSEYYELEEYKRLFNKKIAYKTYSFRTECIEITTDDAATKKIIERLREAELRENDLRDKIKNSFWSFLLPNL